MATQEIPLTIPILMFSNVVFFPKTHLSVNIPQSFFDRIMERGLPESCFVGIVFTEEKQLDKPKALPIGCVGKVDHFHHLPCAHAVHLHLCGLKRFQVEEITWSGSYNGHASIELIEDNPGNLSPKGKKSLHELIRHDQLFEWTPELELLIKSGPSDETYLNLLCLGAKISRMDKYFLLETGSLDQRCGRLLDLLRFKLDDIRYSSY